MRKKIAILAMICVAICTMGANSCTEEDQIAITQAALGSVQIGMQWADTKIAEKCATGTWSVEDCRQWDEQAPLVEDVLNNIIPWAIQKLIETTTPEERTEVSEIIKEHGIRIRLAR